MTSQLVIFGAFFAPYPKSENKSCKSTNENKSALNSMLQVFKATAYGGSSHTAQFNITLLNLDVVDSSSKSLKTAKLK